MITAVPRAVGLRAAGIALFLPVPLVLWLLTRAPWGVARSEAMAVALVLTHPLYARRFARRRAARRCLWCGGAPDGGPELVVEEPVGTTSWRTCGERHPHLCAAVLGWGGRHRTALRAGILGPLLALLAGAPLAARGLVGAVTRPDVVAAFQVGIALSVLPLAFLGPRAPAPVEALRPPFPIHVLSLIGMTAVLWLFRIVGVAWLTLGLLHFWQRALAA